VTDPRDLDSEGIVGPGDPHDMDGVVVDTTNAVLMDEVVVTAVGLKRATKPDKVALALALGGRINMSGDRATVVYLFDMDGAASIVSELSALAGRMGPEFAEALIDRMRKLADEGLTQPKGDGDG